MRNAKEWLEIIGCMAEYKNDGKLYILKNSRVYKLEENRLAKLVYMITGAKGKYVFFTPNMMMISRIEKTNCKII